MGKKPKTDQRVLASNRRARFEYHILEKVEAGIALTGTEVKAARAGKVQLKDSYVDFRNGEAWLVNAHIGHYSHGNRFNHELERPRKLLMHRRQLDKLFGRGLEKGLTVVPLQVYLVGPWIKVEVALVQGKKLYDKRQATKTREMDREAREAMKRRFEGA
jgi:SsrA-binding protein